MKRVISVIVFMLFATSCASTMTTQDKLNYATKGVNAACAVKPTVDLLVKQICEKLSGAKKEKCIKWAEVASTAADAILTVGAVTLSACSTNNTLKQEK